MPEQMQVKMNGVIPSVPITTLAGITSLSDLLPEMPLPTPLPQTLEKKSLLFHPRVAEEAQILLSGQDDNLVPQLISSLSQTSADHIELKDHYANLEQPLENEQNTPELLKAILKKNPHVFKGPQYNSPRSWPQGAQQLGQASQQSPANYGCFSPSYANSSSGMRQTPQGSPGARSVLPSPGGASGMSQAQHPRMPGAPQNHAADVSQMSPFAVPSPSPRATVITEQTRTTPYHYAQDDVLGNMNSQPSMYSPAHMNSNMGNVMAQQQQQQMGMGMATTQQTVQVTSPLQGSMMVQQQQNLGMDQNMFDHSAMNQHLQHPLGNYQMGMQDNQQQQQQQPFVVDPIGVLPELDLAMDSIIGKQEVNEQAQQPMMVFPEMNASSHVPHQENNGTEKSAKIVMKEPVVMLNRLSLADQALMQKSLSALAEKNKAAKAVPQPKSESESEEEEEDDDDEVVGKNNKYFKARAKERQAQKEKDRAEKKKGEERGRKRRRVAYEEGNSDEEKKESPTKPKIRKFEKKLVPVLAKLNVEELMETNTYQRFNATIDTIFENTDDIINSAELNDDEYDVPAELLIPKYELQDLCTEAAKLKALGAMESIPSERLVKLLNILEKNIRDGARVSPLADPDDDVEESRMWMQLAMERVQRAVESSLIALHIMTSNNMPKTVYLEDVIDRIVLFMKFQLQNTIYPSYDPVYKIDSKCKTDNFNASGRKKRGHMKEVREKTILQLYNKMQELVGLLAELLNIQGLTDTIVLHTSTLGVSPFFVESIGELQLRALKLVTVIFTKYDKHRKLLLDDILTSIARLPSSKKSLRTYRLNSEEQIQMLTALVLQLIQCIVVLPETLIPPGKNAAPTPVKTDEDGNEKKEEKKIMPLDADVLVNNKYDTARRTAMNFLVVFLSKCGSKGEEVDYRPLFENFVQDLLTTVNKPEWPAAELLLSILGHLLVSHFSNKSSDMSLRVASIEYLGVVAAKLRKDAVSSQCKLSTIDQIIADIKTEQMRDSDYDQFKDQDISGLSEDEKRTIFLQKVLLDYLAVNGTKDSAMGFARHFYVAQWYRNCLNEKRSVGQAKHTPSKKHHQPKKRGRKKNRHISDDDTESEPEELDQDENDNNEQKNSEVYRIIECKKKIILSKIRPYSSGTRHDILQTYIDYNSAELISQYLASKQPFSQSFDKYLQHILNVLTESSIAIRTKAMKCLTMIVEVDPSVLGRADMQLGVNHSFLDHSTSVREAAVDLVGKFVLSRPDLINKYYNMLSARILDTGVSVRKRVIKILKDICIECPDFSKIPEICVKMIRRVNDEEGIRKLVMEVFQNMWFTPIKDSDSQALIRKVMNITDVVAASKDMGLEWFEQLLLSLFKPKEDKEDSTKVNHEPSKALLKACTQIVDCLIQNVLKLEETNEDYMDEEGRRKGSSQRLVACLTTLHLFAKIRPQLLVNHAITLQPYLSLKCQSHGDHQIISSVAHTLELVVPLMEHPSETFLAQLEEDSVKLILQQDKSVVASCLSCLGSIVNNVTKNYKLIRDCFKKYYGFLNEYKIHYEKNPSHAALVRQRPLFHRSLFTVGLLLRHFDFTQQQVIDSLPENIKDQVFETLLYFVNLEDNEIREFTLSAIGSLCIRHYEFMLLPEVKELYHHLLTSEVAQIKMRVQVLSNVEKYLLEEETRMIRQDQEWAKNAKQANLKEMNDVSSGMASTVIQIYLKEILESFLHSNVNVRHAAMKVIQLILSQGLVNPIEVVPYLICMSTDLEKSVSHTADKQLQDIDKKYPGFINMRSIYGIKLSYRLQELLQLEPPVRGMRTKEGEFPGALNGFLYSILRSTRVQRRATLTSILKQFDESAKTSLSQMLYLADNLAYFSYQVQDEPLFVIHYIDVNLSINGTNLVQSFKEALLPKEGSAAALPPSIAVQPVQEQQQQQQMPVQYQMDQYNQQYQLYPQQQQYPYQQQQQPQFQQPYPVQQDPSQVPPQVPDTRPRPEQMMSAILEDEEDDDEDEETLLERLPDDTTLLREYITASQGFLLLLTLRQHLKDLYGLTDAKIGQYSPTDAVKIHEKALNRKSSIQFKPKATLQRLRRSDDREELDESGRKKLVKEFLDFKQLMLKYDLEDADEDEDKPDPASRVQVAEGERHPEQGQGVAAEQGSNAPNPTPPTTQRVPKLTIHAHDIKEHRKKSHKTEKPKKHKKKKRRRISDSDSGDDYSDPDFQM